MKKDIVLYNRQMAKSQRKVQLDWEINIGEVSIHPQRRKRRTVQTQTKFIDDDGANYSPSPSYQQSQHQYFQSIQEPEEFEDPTEEEDIDIGAQEEEDGDPDSIDAGDSPVPVYTGVKKYQPQNRGPEVVRERLFSAPPVKYLQTLEPPASQRFKSRLDANLVSKFQDFQR